MKRHGKECDLGNVGRAMGNGALFLKFSVFFRIRLSFFLICFISQTVDYAGRTLVVIKLSPVSINLDISFNI